MGAGHTSIHKQPNNNNDYNNPKPNNECAFYTTTGNNLTT